MANDPQGGYTTKAPSLWIVQVFISVFLKLCESNPTLRNGGKIWIFTLKRKVYTNAQDFFSTVHIWLLHKISKDFSFWLIYRLTSSFWIGAHNVQGILHSASPNGGSCYITIVHYQNRETDIDTISHKILYLVLGEFRGPRRLHTNCIIRDPPSWKRCLRL